MTDDNLLARDVREEFAKSRSYFRVARVLGITMDKVKAILGEDMPPIQRRKALFGGQGRPELRRFIVATKHTELNWDNTIPEIAMARAAYEAGTHEMATGYDGDTAILYLIPRAKTQPRPNYFTPGYTS